jgi:hypothetical protein
LRFRLVRGVPPYRPPRSAAIAAAVLAGLGLTAALVPTTEGSPVICPFRALTGLPCPTCGMVRTAHLILRGRIVSAFAVNPLDALFLTIVVPAALMLWVANRRAGVGVGVELEGREGILAWVAVALAVGANWIYVLATVR